MDKRIDIPISLYEDELIVFLADRYHVTPKKMLVDFLVRDGIIPASETSTGALPLEDNEVEILRGLTKEIVYNKKR